MSIKSNTFVAPYLQPLAKSWIDSKIKQHLEAIIESPPSPNHLTWCPGKCSVFYGAHDPQLAYPSHLQYFNQTWFATETYLLPGI